MIRDLGDFGEESRRAVGDFVALAGLGAEHAREVMGVFAAEFGEAVIDGGNEEAAAGGPL